MIETVITLVVYSVEIPSMGVPRLHFVMLEFQYQQQYVSLISKIPFTGYNQILQKSRFKTWLEFRRQISMKFEMFFI